MSLQPTNRAPAPAWLVWVALWIIYIVWGSTYLAIGYTVDTLPPLMSAGVRFVVAGLIVYLFLLARRGPKGVSITWREAGASAAIGTALLLGGNGLVAIAEQEVPTAVAALIIASVPLWVVILRSLFGDRARAGTLVGVGIGLAGVAVLVLPGGSDGNAPLGGMLILVGAAMAWATGSFFSKRVPLPKDPFTSTAWQMLLGGVVLLVTGAARGELEGLDAGSFSRESLLALAYLIVFGSLLAFTAYTWLLQNAPISKVATYAYVNPVVAIFLGWWLRDEEITTSIIVGAAIIVAAVAFIVSQESRSNGSRKKVEATPAGAEALEAAS